MKKRNDLLFDVDPPENDKIFIIFYW